jgi:hypothetical protein
VKAISNHQLRLVLLGSVNHRSAFLFGYGHRLFAEHMNTCVRGSHRVLTMKMVRYGDVNGINLAECAVVLFVGIDMVETVLLTKFFSLFGFSGYYSDQF